VPVERLMRELGSRRGPGGRKRTADAGPGDRRTAVGPAAIGFRCAAAEPPLGRGHHVCADVLWLRCTRFRDENCSPPPCSRMAVADHRVLIWSSSAGDGDMVAGEEGYRRPGHSFRPGCPVQALYVLRSRRAGRGPSVGGPQGRFDEMCRGSPETALQAMSSSTRRRTGRESMK